MQYVTFIFSSLLTDVFDVGKTLLLQPWKGLFFDSRRLGSGEPTTYLCCARRWTLELGAWSLLKLNLLVEG
eukprot:scaffold8447_cov66-Cyclotella_meneghiniana.AAC.11